MKYKIVSDSTANILALNQVPFASVPLHIMVGSHEFIDDANVNLAQMEEALSSCKVSSTACPGLGDWLYAFEDAELQLLDNYRGEQRALSCIIKHMKEMGYHDGRVRIAHNGNETAAQKLMHQIQDTFEVSDIRIDTTRALCSYYAEKGGLLVALEC